jgi:squalene-hopene/tetraprenyl-beta-curcumene cyclase
LIRNSRVKGCKTVCLLDKTGYCVEVISIERVEAALASARADLVEACPSCDHWESDLPGSATATAAAVVALALAEGASSTAGLQHFESRITDGQDWIVKHINPDGGWGDVPGGPSNAVATAFCWAALAVNFDSEANHPDPISKAQAWLRTHGQSSAPTGDLTADFLLAAMSARHGNDRTLTVPALTACALTGRFEDETAWRGVPRFPFEMAVLPRSWYRFLSLPAAGHALPAMLAVGLAHHSQAPTRNPLVGAIRGMTRMRARAMLDKIQPSSGGFLESVLLTSFTVMGLSAVGQGDDLAVKKGLAFLQRSQREDGGWPIDSNLDTRVTTLAASALLLTGQRMPVEELQEWLLTQQFGEIHPGTNSPPGGWSWTHLPGGVPDAKDTSEALLVLRGIARLLPVPKTARRHQAGLAGVRWLLNLQNSDGGVSTFMRSRSRLAVDWSSPDVTAHALRAWLAWGKDYPALKNRIARAVNGAFSYLRSTQNRDGSWGALWYGTGRDPEGENLTCGTTRVALALGALMDSGFAGAEAPLASAVEWLVKTQFADGGWGAGNGGNPSVEETAWAVECLALFGKTGGGLTALNRGIDWLVVRVESGAWKTAAPLGLHFARVGYSEPLFPRIFTVAALSRARAALSKSATPA